MARFPYGFNRRVGGARDRAREARLKAACEREVRFRMKPYSRSRTNHFHSIRACQPFRSGSAWRSRRTAANEPQRTRRASTEATSSSRGPSTNTKPTTRRPARSRARARWRRGARPVFACLPLVKRPGRLCGQGIRLVGVEPTKVVDLGFPRLPSRGVRTKDVGGASPIRDDDLALSGDYFLEPREVRAQVANCNGRHVVSHR
jgi:hypothetical protein